VSHGRRLSRFEELHEADICRGLDFMNLIFVGLMVFVYMLIPMLQT